MIPRRMLVVGVLLVCVAGGAAVAQYTQPPCMWTVVMTEGSVDADRAMYVVSVNPTDRVQLVEFELLTPTGAAPTTWHEEFPAKSRRAVQLFPGRDYARPIFLSLIARWPTFGTNSLVTFAAADTAYLSGLHSPQSAVLACRSGGREWWPLSAPDGTRKDER